MEVAINNTLYQQISAYAQQQGQSLTATIESILLRFIMRSKFATEQSASMKSDSAEEEPSVVAEAEAFTPRVMRFKRGNPWYATDEEVDRMRHEYLIEKYFATSAIPVYELDEFMTLIDKK